jgi:hypothetical protein
MCGGITKHPDTSGINNRHESGGRIVLIGFRQNGYLGTNKVYSHSCQWITPDRGCGLDVHKGTVVATVRGDNFDTEIKTFLTFTG